jgi:hypothetical protein
MTRLYASVAFAGPGGLNDGPPIVINSAIEVMGGWPRIATTSWSIVSLTGLGDRSAISLWARARDDMHTPKRAALPMISSGRFWPASGCFRDG